MDKDYKYHLEKYKGQRTRHTCPQCGRKNSFVRYVDEEGKSLEEYVGRCNREINCGYHYTPKMFFKDHPNLMADMDGWEKHPRQEPREERPVAYLPKDCLSPLTDGYVRNNNLGKFFIRRFGWEATKAIFDIYHVGTSVHWMFHNGFSTAFPQIDENGRIRQIKVMIYNPDTGRRLHETDKALRYSANYKIRFVDCKGPKVWFAGKSILKDWEANFQQTFFGTHLIPHHPSDVIGVVESEKTAMIASIYWKGKCPSTTWIATGGKNGCKWTSWDVLRVLKGRKVILYPDLNCYGDWSEKAEMLRRYNIDVQVSHYLEDICTDEEREQGLDIADYLLRNPYTL